MRGALGDLVPLEQFKKHKKTQGVLHLVKLQAFLK